MAAVHADYAKQALLRAALTADAPTPSPKKSSAHDASLNYLLLGMAALAWSKAKASQSGLTLHNVTLAFSLMLPWIFGIAGVMYMLVAIYARSTVLAHEDDRERWREAARVSDAGGKLDLPRGAAVRGRTLSDLVRGGSESVLDPVIHQRNLALLSEWRSERQEKVSAKPAGVMRSRSWSALPRVEDPTPRVVRARSAPVRPTARAAC